jgi:hypothetical protein
MSQPLRIWTDEDILAALATNPLDLKATIAIATQHVPRLRELADTVISCQSKRALRLVDTAVVSGVKTAVANLKSKSPNWSLARWLDHCVEQKAQSLGNFPL